MTYSYEIKKLAHQLDPDCWESYSGMPIRIKRGREIRRKASLELAEKTLRERGELPEPEFCPHCGQML